MDQRLIHPLLLPSEQAFIHHPQPRITGSGSSGSGSGSHGPPQGIIFTSVPVPGTDRKCFRVDDVL